MHNNNNNSERTNEIKPLRECTDDNIRRILGNSIQADLLSSTSPSTSSVSSTVPPSLRIRRTSARFTVFSASALPVWSRTVDSLSTTRRIASTAIGASREAFCETTFELSDVLAIRMSVSRSVSSTGIAQRVSNSRTPIAAAFWNDSLIAVGWIPLPRRLLAASKSAPARTTTVVVPSPASTSCARDSSTSYTQVSKKKL